jgi:acetyl-CoA acetyltransferase
VAAAIIGTGESPYVRRAEEGVSTPDALADAAARALRDAGLRRDQIDGLAVASFSLAPDHAIDLCWQLGLSLRWIMEETNGGAAALNMLQHAVAAVERGEASAVMVVAGDVMSSRGFGRMVDSFNSVAQRYLTPLPHGGPNSLFALLTQRHAGAHGLEREDYAVVPMSQRAWAAGNPGAVYRAPLELGEYLAAPMVSDPLCRFDCVPVVSGADAIVVADENRDRDGGAVTVRALRSSFNRDHQAGEGLQTGLAPLADELWGAAGVGPGEIDMASVYDDYPAMVLIQLEDLGFAPGGDVKRLIHEGLATRALPVNTSGGQLSAGQAGTAGGLHGLVEAVRQLREEAGGRQVEGARLALVTGYGMVLYRYGACASAVVLERKRGPR